MATWARKGRPRFVSQCKERLGFICICDLHLCVRVLRLLKGAWRDREPPCLLFRFRCIAGACVGPAWQAQGVGGLLGPVSGDLQVITVERGPSVRERVTPVLRWGARHHRIAAQCSDSRPIKYIISFSIDDSHYSEDSLFLDALAIICTSYIRTT